MTSSSTPYKIRSGHPLRPQISGMCRGYLETRVHQDTVPGKLFVDSQRHSRSLCWLNCAPVSTPPSPRAQLKPATTRRELSRLPILTSKVIGSLMYAALDNLHRTHSPCPFRSHLRTCPHRWR